MFSGTTGKLIADSGVFINSYLPLAGGTMSGSINMGIQTITNVASIATSTGDINIGNNNTIGTNGCVTVGAGNTGGGSAVVFL